MLSALTRNRKFLRAGVQRLLIEGQRSSGGQTVEMKMIQQGLVPGMKHRDEADLSAKTSTAKLDERFANGFKEMTQQNLFVGQYQTVDFVRQGEHQMEVAHRQDF
jgi:hypothetical protein